MEIEITGLNPNIRNEVVRLSNMLSKYRQKAADANFYAIKVEERLRELDPTGTIGANLKSDNSGKYIK